MLNAYKLMLREWNIFNIRIDRRTYWSGLLIMLLFQVVTLWLSATFTSLYWVQTIYAVAMIVPVFAFTLRRLKDVNKSPFTILLALIPVIGWVGLFIYLIQEGK